MCMQCNVSAQIYMWIGDKNSINDAAIKNEL